MEERKLEAARRAAEEEAAAEAARVEAERVQKEQRAAAVKAFRDRLEASKKVTLFYMNIHCYRYSCLIVLQFFQMVLCFSGMNYVGPGLVRRQCNVTRCPD